jgi:hypothetical protein
MYFVRIFVPSMDILFKKGNRIVRVQHVRITSKLLCWVLEHGLMRENISINEIEDHVDLCIG